MSTLAILSIALLHCGGESLSPRDGGRDGTVDGAGDDAAGRGPPTCGALGSFCSTLDASVPTCDGASGWRCAVDTSCTTPTTLSGKVFDPAGETPLYNVIVLIPNVVTALPPIRPGAHTCNPCDAFVPNDYVAATTTDSAGAFSLRGVPTGREVPVTVQTGKWRRTVPVNIPASCTTTQVADGTLRLPRSRKEGDMPQMALLTGGCDDLGCFLTNMGIDPQEFTAPQGGGRLDVYQGLGAQGSSAAGLSSGIAGDCTGGACPLWSSKQTLEYYDLAILSCECGENNQTKPAAAMQAMHDWLDEGGKVFASHYQYTWFKNNPQTDFQNVATWLGSSVAAGAGTYDLNTTFPKGQILAQWLGSMGALADGGPPPAVDLSSVGASVSTVNARTTVQWIYDPSTSPNNTKYLSFGTPIGGAPPPPCGVVPGAVNGYCGKAVFTDLHTSGGPVSTVGSIPSGCTQRGLSPQQKALEYLFFDLAACVVNDIKPPPLPPGYLPPPCDAGGG